MPKILVQDNAGMTQKGLIIKLMDVCIILWDRTIFVIVHLYKLIQRIVTMFWQSILWFIFQKAWCGSLDVHNNGSLSLCITIHLNYCHVITLRFNYDNFLLEPINDEWMKFNDRKFSICMLMIHNMATVTPILAKWCPTNSDSILLLPS